MIRPPARGDEHPSSTGAVDGVSRHRPSHKPLRPWAAASRVRPGAAHFGLSAARCRREERGGDRREHAKAPWHSIFESWAQDLKGIDGRVRAWAALRPASVESRFEAMHVTGLTALRARRRTRTAAAPMVESKNWRRSGRTALWRTGHRQIAVDCGAHVKASQRAAYAPALFLLAAAYRQCVLSDRRSDRTCARGRIASAARQARCSARISTSKDDAVLFNVIPPE